MNPLFEKLFSKLPQRNEGRGIQKLLAPLFAKLAKKRGATAQAAKEQPVGTMQPGYEAASRNTTLLS